MGSINPTHDKFPLCLILRNNRSKVFLTALKIRAAKLPFVDLIKRFGGLRPHAAVNHDIMAHRHKYFLHVFEMTNGC